MSPFNVGFCIWKRLHTKLPNLFYAVFPDAGRRCFQCFPGTAPQRQLCSSSGQEGVLGLHLQGHKCPQPLCWEAPALHMTTLHKLGLRGEYAASFKKALLTSVIHQQLLVELQGLHNFVLLKSEIWFASWNFWQVHNGSKIMDIINSLKWSSRNSNTSVMYCSDFLMLIMSMNYNKVKIFK